MLRQALRSVAPLLYSVSRVGFELLGFPGAATGRLFRLKSFLTTRVGLSYSWEMILLLGLMITSTSSLSELLWLQGAMLMLHDTP